VSQERSDGPGFDGGVGLFEHLPVLTVLTTVDDSGTQIIDDCNDRFARRLGRTRSELCGRPLRGVYRGDSIPPDTEAKDSAGECRADRRAESDGGSVETPGRDRQPSAPVEGDRSVAVGPRVGDRRPFRLPVAGAGDGEPDSDCLFALVDAEGHLVQTIAEALPRSDGDGHVVFHVDVTRQQRREWQAEVLNRLMRHNVRNDLNILRGHASTLTEHQDEEVVEAAEVIDRVADRWLGLAETVRDIERLFDDAAVETATVRDIVTSVQQTVEREWPEGRVDVRIDVDPECRISERLHVALVELCENGIKHAGESAEDGGRIPVSVTIARGTRPGWLAVRVADNGPGIPTHELSALHVDGETPLRHGSGLGLWLVRFVVRRLGGEISARHRDDGGSVVSLHLPLADDR